MIVLGLGIAVGIGSANTPLGHAIILIPIQLLLEQTGLSVNIISYSIFGFITGLIIFAALILIVPLPVSPGSEPYERLRCLSLKRISSRYG